MPLNILNWLYTKLAYRQFISAYYDEYRIVMLEDPSYYNDEMAWYDPFAKGGY